MTGALVHWSEQSPGSWTFLPLPRHVAGELREVAARVAPSAAFGAFPVVAILGATRWRTSVVGIGDGEMALPVKQAVRRAEHVEAGDIVTVALSIAL